MKSRVRTRTHGSVRGRHPFGGASYSIVSLSSAKVISLFVSSAPELFDCSLVCAGGIFDMPDCI